MDELIAHCKNQTANAMERFLRNLSRVPVERLDWSPSPTAKTVLQIAAHVAGYSGAFASIIRACEFPATVGEFMAPINLAIDGVHSVAEADAVLRLGITDTLDALDTVTPERIESSLDTPIGPTPFLFFMTIPSVHLTLHTGQIDYLQTCWGDQEVYI